MLPADAAVTVGELVPKIVEWARGPLAHLFGDSLDDPRVGIEVRDVYELIAGSRGAYDAILLDVDNGPDGLIHVANDRLYGKDGLRAAYQALKPGGVLAIWSAYPDKAFTDRMARAGFRVDELKVRATGGRKGAHHVIWVGDSGRACLDLRALRPTWQAMLIETETTPNPATLKFLPGRTVMDAGTRDFADARGSRGVAAGRGAVRAGRRDRRVLRPRLRVGHRRAGRRLARPQARRAGDPARSFLAPACRCSSRAAPADIRADDDGDFADDPADADIVAQIRELIDTRVRPAVANDGGDIVYRGFDKGKVYLRCRAPARAARRRPRR